MFELLAVPNGIDAEIKMHFPIKRAALLSLLVAMGLPIRTAHAQSATPQMHGHNSPVAEPTEGSSRQTVGWIVAGIGGVSLLGSGYLVLLRNQKRDDMHDVTGAEVVAELQPYQTAATALFAAGVAGIAVGLPLALIGDDDTRVVVSLDRVAVSGTF